MKAVATVTVLALLVFAGMTTVAGSNGLVGTYKPCKWFSYPSIVPLSGDGHRSSATVTDPIPAWADEIAGRLAYKVTMDLRNSTLEESAWLLADLLKVSVILSSEARSSSASVTLKTHSMRGALALNWVCRLADADWKIVDEAIYVFLKSEVEESDRSEPSLDELLDILDEMTYTPPDFPAPSDPFGREDRD